MTANRWGQIRWWGVLTASAGLMLVAGPAWAAGAGDEPQVATADITVDAETMTMRGQTFTVWPFDDLRRRGFDIKDVAPEDNAFLTYRDAINVYHDLPEDLAPAFDYAVNTAWPVGHDGALKAFMLEPDNQKALRLTREAAEREEFQLYYYGDPRGSIITVLLPSLSSFRQLAKLLVVDGRRLEAQGAYDLAAENYLTTLRMGGQLGNGITLIENLVGMAVWTSGSNALGQMVVRRNLSPELLQEIHEELADLAGQRPSVISGIQNEKKFGTTIVDEYLAHPAMALQSWQGIDADALPSVAVEDSGWGRLEQRVGQLVFPDRTIKRHMIAFYDALIERASQPAWAAWNGFKEEQIFAQIPAWNFIARVLLPSLSRAAVLGERCRMQTMTVRLAVALRLYALANQGQAPERLDQLSAYLSPDEWVDPFSGRPFVYEQREGAWRLYSLSDNFTDDGGKVGDTPFELDYMVRFPAAAVDAFEPPAEEDPA